MVATYHVKRSRKLQKRYEKMPKRVREAVNPAVVAAAQDLANLQRDLAPHETGRLEASITVTRPGGTTPALGTFVGAEQVPDNAAAVTAGDKDAFYAHFVEYGTKKMAARPFFWPAYRLLRRRMTNRIKRAITKAIKADRGL